MNFRRPFSRLLVLFFRLGFVFAEPVVKADGVFQLAAGGARADAGNGLDGAGQLVHEFDGLFGAGDAVFVTCVEVVGELFADGQDLFGRVEFAGLGIAAAFAGKAQIIDKADAVVDLAGKQRAGGRRERGVVAVAAAAGTVEDEPGEFVFFTHGFLGNQGHARIAEAAEDFDTCTDRGETAFGTDVEVWIGQRADKGNRSFGDVEVLAVGFVAAFDNAHGTNALDGFART